MLQVAPIKDTDIQRNVLDELGWSPEIEPTQIGVHVDRGIVTLTGTVTTYAEKLAAERAAQRVFGVRALANDLEVRPPDAGYRTDTEIARAVANAFEWSALVPDERIQISVSDGAVTLYGSVDFNFQRIEAERLAMQLNGVKGVNGHITITPPITATPEEIQASILGAMRRHAEIREDAFAVEVCGHTVVLTGAVSSEAQRGEAGRLAWGPGVHKVDNRIEIEPEQI